MSRALDKHVIAALKKGDHQKVFDDISRLFVQQEDDRRLEIEILGQGHPLGPDEHLLRDENAVAVPKLRIVQAFLFARQILQEHLAGDSVGIELLLSATSVMLLMDPEHLTATNTRKRLIRDAISADDDSLRWCNESVWWFLRTTGSSPAMGQTGRQQLAIVQEKLLVVNANGSTEAMVLKTARKWCELFGPRADATISRVLG
ncbi:hypothetical protein CSPAE12_08734 [Colletotrichum incanum]|nr:hypothetical protein CSPAE12_08734 [Colletotrichum incanum]